MEKLYLVLILMAIGAEVLSMGIRVKRQDSKDLEDKYGWIPGGGEQNGPVQNPHPPNTQSPADCVRGCPVTTEYNPVCGTDYVTYPNPGRLLCAQACGTNVTLLRQSRCPPADAASSSPAAS